MDLQKIDFKNFKNERLLSTTETFLKNYVSLESRKTHISVLKNFFIFLKAEGITCPTLLTPIEAMKYRDSMISRGLSNKHITKCLSSLSSWYKELVEAHLVFSNPIRDIKRPIAKTVKDKHSFTNKELEKLFSSFNLGKDSDRRFYFASKTLFVSSARVSAITHLTKDDVYWENSEIKLLCPIKGNKKEFLTLPAWFSKELSLFLEDHKEKYLFGVNDRPMTIENFNTMLRRRCKKLKLPSPNGSHIFRRSRTNQLLELGLPIKELMRITKHSSILSVQSYLTESEGNWLRLQRAENGLSFTELSRISNLDPTRVSAIENGSNPTEEEFKLLAHAFDRKKEILNSKARVKTKSKDSIRRTNRNEPPLISFKDWTTPYYPDSYLKKYLPDLPIKREKEIRAISLFSGAGIMDLGFHLSGVKTLGFVEKNPHIAEIYKANNPDVPLLADDIQNLSNADLEEISEDFKDIDLIVGGPPCQSFSNAGKREVDNPRNRLFLDYLNFVKAFKPKCFVMENVKGLLSMTTPEKKQVIDEIYYAFKDIGYETRWHLINTSDFFVPQNRERVIIIGLRADINKPITFPTAVCEKKITFREATKDLERVCHGEFSSNDYLHFGLTYNEKTQNVIEAIHQEGFSGWQNPPDLRPTNGFKTAYTRIFYDKPSPTIIRNFSEPSGARNIHPEMNRSLTIREALRLMSVPDSYVFTGLDSPVSFKNVRDSIGNGFPTLSAYYLSKHILERLLAQKSP